MPSTWRKSARVVLRWLAVAAPLGVALGYLSFVLYLPSVAFPSTDRPTPLLVLGVLFVLGVLAGFLSNEVPSVVAQSFLGVAFGVIVDFLMLLSPAFRPGVVAEVPSELLVVAIKFSFAILLLSFLLWIVSGLVGLYLVDLLRRRLPISAVFPGFRENL